MHFVNMWFDFRLYSKHFTEKIHIKNSLKCYTISSYPLLEKPKLRKTVLIKAAIHGKKRFSSLMNNFEISQILILFWKYIIE